MPIGPFRTYSQPVNLRDLEARFDAGAEVSPEALVAKGLLKNTSVDIKILGSGELTKKLAVSAHGFSKSRRRRSRRPAALSHWLRGEPVERKPKVKAASRSRCTSRTTTSRRRESSAEAAEAVEPDEEAEA